MSIAKQPKQSILVPYEGKWELWSYTNGQWLCQNYDDPASITIPEGCIACLPTQTIYSLAIRIICRDDAQIPKMLPFQIESRGIHPKNDEPLVFEYRIAQKKDLHTTVLCSVAGENSLAFYKSARFHSFQIFPHIFLPPPDSITLWKENERFCVAITKQNELVHFQSLTSSELGAELCAELRCISWPLLELDLFPITPQVVIWSNGTFSQDEIEKNLGWPVKKTSRPQPSPSSKWNLMPPSLRSQKERSSKLKQLQLAGILALSIYVLIVGCLIGHIIWVSQATQRLKKELSQIEPIVRQIQIAKREWMDFDLILNPQVSPLKHLIDVTQSLPPSGVKITAFNQDGYDVTIEGESQNVSAAVAFLEKLKIAPSFRGYHWESPQPQLSPSNTAKFKFKALNPYANPKKK